MGPTCFYVRSSSRANTVSGFSCLMFPACLELLYRSSMLMCRDLY